MVLAGLVFKETPNGFPEAVLFYIPSSNAWGIQFLGILIHGQYYYFFKFTILIDVQWYLIVVLIVFP
jgi:hypothetical protein